MYSITYLDVETYLDDVAENKRITNLKLREFIPGFGLGIIICELYHFIKRKK